MSAAIPKVSYGSIVFRLKEGDTQPPIAHQTVDEFQQLVPLTGALSAQFRYRLRTGIGATAVLRTATIVNAENGELRYNWIEDDTLVSGEYYGEWIVTFPNSQTRTFPVRGYVPFVVEADLD
jgi:hypothetical protein